MNFAEVASRIDGISTPVFGISWKPPTADITIARRVVTFVETRRVLFSTYTNEVPAECVASVIAIRDFLTGLVGEGGIGRELGGSLRLMRRQCVQFLTRVGATEDGTAADAAGRHLFRDLRWHMHDYFFGEALGEFRAGVGLQIAIIATAFGLDVEDDLARTLPPPEPQRQ